MTVPIPASQKPRSFRLFRSVVALIMREMATTYGRSPGGYLWAVLEPVGAVAILSYVFSYTFSSPSLGTNFPYFYATGFLPFSLYMAVNSSVASSIRFSRQLLEYPSVTFVDAIIARFVLNLTTEVLVMVVVFAGIIFIYDLNPIFNWIALGQALFMVAMFSFGVGVMNCYLMTSFPVWERVWSILNRPVFIVSGIFFIPESLGPKFAEYMMFVPVADIISLTRKGFYPTYEALYVDQLYVLSISLVMIIFGMYMLMRYYKDIIIK